MGYTYTVDGKSFRTDQPLTEAELEELKKSDWEEEDSACLNRLHRMILNEIVPSIEERNSLYLQNDRIIS